MSWIRGAVLIVLLVASAACGDDPSSTGATVTVPADPSPSSTPAAGPGATTQDPGPGPTTPTTAPEVLPPPEPDEAFYLSCRQQWQAMADGFGSMDLEETGALVEAWQRSGCEDVCGQAGVPTNPQCIEP